MEALGSTQKAVRVMAHASQFSWTGPRWDVAFLGILTYLIIEYSRIAAMFPVLQPLQLGKAAILITALAYPLSARSAGRTGDRAYALEAGSAAFLVGCFFSCCFASYQKLAWNGFIDVLRWGVIYLLLSRVLANRWRLRIFVFLFFLLNLKLAQFAIREYFSERAFGRTSEYLAGHGEGAGSTGFFGNAGDFGVAMCVVWPLAVSLLQAQAKKVQRLFLAICFTVFFVAILVCGSRGALLGACVAMLVGLLKSPKKLLVSLTVLFCFPGAFWLLPQANKERIQSAFDPNTDATASIRLNLWKAGIRMFSDHPLAGVGLSNFPPFYASLYRRSDPNPENWVPHSIYIQAFSELGMVGSLPFVLVLVLFFRLNGKTRRRLLKLGLGEKRSFEYCLATGLDLAMVGYLISGGFLAVLYYPHLYVLLGLTVALHTTCMTTHPEKGIGKLQKRDLALAAV